MAQLGKFLRKSSTGYLHYCPACENVHQYRVGGDISPQWTFDGNVDKPTFSPSMLIFHTDRYADGGILLNPPQRRTICHYTMTAGMIYFHGDSPHKLSGQTVPLPELPEWMQGDRFSDGVP